MFKEIINNIKRMQEQLDEIKGMHVSDQTVNGPNTLHRFLSHKNAQAEGSKNSTFSFNNQFSTTLQRQDLQRESLQREVTVTESKNLDSEYVEDFEKGDAVSSSLDDRIQIATNLPPIPQEPTPTATVNSLSRASSSVKSFNNDSVD